MRQKHNDIIESQLFCLWFREPVAANRGVLIGSPHISGSSTLLWSIGVCLNWTFLFGLSLSDSDSICTSGFVPHFHLLHLRLCRRLIHAHQIPPSHPLIGVQMLWLVVRVTKHHIKSTSYSYSELHWLEFLDEMMMAWWLLFFQRSPSCVPIMP